jgi:aminopeptidase
LLIPTKGMTVMHDPRLENLANTIVNYSTRVRPGDKVAIRGFPLTPAATPLINAVTEQVLKAGGYPHLLMTPPEYRKLLFENALEDQLGYTDPFVKMVMEEFDVDIRITSAENTKALATVDPDRVNNIRTTYHDLLQTWFQRSAQGTLRWLTTRYPTSAYAQEAEMSLIEYEQFFFTSCFADLEDPIEAFQQLAAAQDELAGIFQGGDQVALSGPHIDLKLSIKDRPLIRCIGHRNLPDGEVYFGPVVDSVEGWVRFSFPCIYSSMEVKGVELEFEAGKVIKARADTNEEYLLKTLEVDEGASRLGEFGIGMNTAIDRFTGLMLFDEKIAGTIHLALGAGYPESGSRNKSSIHWDMLVDMRVDSEIRLDDKVIYSDGKFR